MRSFCAGVAVAVVLTSCSTEDVGPVTHETGECERLSGVFVSVREREWHGEDEGGPRRNTLTFDGDRALFYEADTVEEGIVDCFGNDVLFRYSDIHASEGEPMASGWLLASTPAPVLWLRGEAFVPQGALAEGGVPLALALSQVRGQVEAVVRSPGYSFDAHDGWRMGPAVITLHGGAVIDVPAGTKVIGGCLDPDIPDFRDTDCWVLAFVDGNGTASQLWSGEIVDGVVRFFPPGRVGPGSRLGGVRYRLGDTFTVQEPCDMVAGESEGEQLRRAITTSREVEFLLEPETGYLLAVVCHLDD